jgi:hypothetical protein
MESSKLAIKFFAASKTQPTSKQFIPVFHQWIQKRAIAEHLLIDVASYEHVAAGPGVVLVAHEGNFYADLDGGLGLLYTRKTALQGDLTQRWRQVLRYALRACRLLEQTESLDGLRFGTSNPRLQIADRLMAPNTPETLAAVRDAIEEALIPLYGGAVQLRQNEDPESLFEVAVVAPTELDAATLLERLGT